MKSYMTLARQACLQVAETFKRSLSGSHNPPPPPNRQGNPKKSAEQIGGPIFRQNSFPLSWIAVPGPKHTFPLVVVQLESCGNSKCPSMFEK